MILAVEITHDTRNPRTYGNQPNHIPHNHRRVFRGRIKPGDWTWNTFGHWTKVIDSSGVTNFITKSNIFLGWPVNGVWCVIRRKRARARKAGRGIHCGVKKE